MTAAIVADVLNAALYAIEGEKAEAILAVVQISVPLAMTKIGNRVAVKLEIEALDASKYSVDELKPILDSPINIVHNIKYPVPGGFLELDIIKLAENAKDVLKEDALVDELLGEAALLETKGALGRAILESGMTDPMLKAWKYVKTSNAFSCLTEEGLETLKILANDIKENPTFAAKLEERPELVRTWKEVLNRNVPVAWKTNPNYLEEFAKALIEKPGIDAKMKGYVNNLDKAIGCHLSSAVDGINVQVRTPQPDSDLPLFYPDGSLKEAFIDINDGEGNMIPKNLASTFFPSGWDVEKVLEEIANVKSTPNTKQTDRIWRGEASDGTTIIIEYTGQDLNNLTFSTAYAVF